MQTEENTDDVVCGLNTLASRNTVGTKVEAHY